MDDTLTWNLPDTEICSAAWQLAFEASPDVLVNHCVRSYLFARELAAADGLRAGADYDDELVFLGCLLHDLGLTEIGRGEQRFEVEGADAAARFLRERGLAEERTTVVWQAIALHASVGLAHRFGADQAVTFRGITLDIDGREADRLSPGFVERVHAAWPRHDVGYALADLIADRTRADPRKAPPFSLPGHLHGLINGEPVTFFDVIDGAPWGDRSH